MTPPQATRRRRRSRRRGGDSDEHEGMERWLLTYADMITLLMALFMVLFSISSVNVSKFETLKETLESAFTPKVLSGGGSILPGGGQRPSPEPPAERPLPAALPTPPESGAGDPSAEQDEFWRLKRLLDAYARRHGFAASIETMVKQRGLVIRLLTDRVLFDSGSAVVKPEAKPLLKQISRLVNLDSSHPISVEGHTDAVPIANGRYPSNWELSTARAASVVRFLASEGVSEGRLEASGVAGLRPIGPNSTRAGRSRNRRVEIALLRINPVPKGGSTDR